MVPGFASHEAFRSGGVPVIGNEVYYDGNSQGAILGGAYLAISQDVTRGVLGEAGMNYSLLLQRSVDWDDYKLVLDPAYPEPWVPFLILSAIVMTCSAVYLSCLIFAGARLAAVFRRRQVLSAGLSSAVGALFVWFGVKLAGASLT